MASVSNCISLPVQAILVLVLYLALSANANRPPTISIGVPYSGKKGVLPLSEDTPLNSILAIMEIKDEDAGADGEVECSTDNPYIGILLAFPMTYKVKLVKELDRETVDTVQVSITCSDKGAPPMSSTGMLTIEIIDINDNAPTFAKSAYSANVTEGMPNGTFVTRVKATDHDAKLNGFVEYSLYTDSLGDVSHFTIDNDTGKIFTKMEIDRESVDQFTLVVVAADSGLPRLSSTAQIRIQVLDINDNAPVVLTTELHALENQKPMSHIGTIHAEDLDLGKNSELVFAKREGSDLTEASPFLVHPNGEVIAAVSLDREQKRQYVLEVIVKDKGSNPRQTSTATIDIFIDDINDNAPIITSDCIMNEDDYSELNYEVYPASNNFSSGYVIIDWYAPQNGRVVYKVEAVDEDSGENGRLFFSIKSAISGVSHNTTKISDPLYKIDSSTGEISFRRFARNGDILTQILNISVSDRGESPLSTFCLLNITIDVDARDLTTPRDASYRGAEGYTNKAGISFTIRTGLISSSHFSISLFIIFLVQRYMTI